MNSQPLQKIDCEVTFLRETEAGPLPWPKKLSGNSYQPHLVVGDPKQRRAILKARMEEGRTGKAWADKYIDEDYVGVAFELGPDNAKKGVPFNVTLILTYWPHPLYKRLVVGASFTIREGETIVGFGKVLRWHQAE